MDLSVREAAALMGRSPRTVRAQVARGDLPGVKHNGKWQLPRHGLPLTEVQREALQRKADGMRDSVNQVLPSRVSHTAGQRHRSIADLDSFRRGAEVLADIRGAESEALPEAVRDRVVELLEEALFNLAEAVQQFDREVKLLAVQRSGAALARAVYRDGVVRGRRHRGWRG